MYARPSTNRRSAAISCSYPRSNPAGPAKRIGLPQSAQQADSFLRARLRSDTAGIPDPPTIGRPAKPFLNAQPARPFPPQSSGTEVRHRLFSACGAPAPADRRCRENRPRPSACPTSPPAPCRTLARPRSAPGPPNFPGLSALPASPGQQENEKRTARNGQSVLRCGTRPSVRSPERNPPSGTPTPETGERHRAECTGGEPDKRRRTAGKVPGRHRAMRPISRRTPTGSRGSR